MYAGIRREISRPFGYHADPRRVNGRSASMAKAGTKMPNAKGAKSARAPCKFSTPITA